MKSDQEIVPADRENFSSSTEPMSISFGIMDLSAHLHKPSLKWRPEEFTIFPTGKEQHEIGS
jgi:hypothetical protein